MKSLRKLNFLLSCTVVLLEFSVGDDEVIKPQVMKPQRIFGFDKRHIDLTSTEKAGNRTEHLRLAMLKGDMDEVRNEVKDGLLEEYLIGKNERQRSKFLEKVYSKTRTIQKLISTKMAVIRKEDTNTSEGVFDVFLVPQTNFIIYLLINKTAIETWNHPEYPGKPLHLICGLPDVSPKTVKYVLDNGKDNVNVKNAANITALHIATAIGNLELVKFLVENGAHINYSATSPGDKDEVGHYQFKRLFSKKKVVVPDIPFHFNSIVTAVMSDNTDVVKYLIKKGIDMNNNGMGWLAFFFPVIFGNTEMVKVLLENGIKVNDKDIFGATALHKAAQKGSIEMTKILLIHGADVNATDILGWTPLHVASFYSRSVQGKDMLQLLLEAGSNPNTKTDGGYTPLHLILASGSLNFLTELKNNYETTRELLNIRAVNSDQKQIQKIEFLLDEGAVVTEQDSVISWSPLHWAAATGDLKVVKLLLDRGADLNLKSNLGLSPLDTAKQFGRKDVIEILRKT